MFKNLAVGDVIEKTTGIYNSNGVEAAYTDHTFALVRTCEPQDDGGFHIRWSPFSQVAGIDGYRHMSKIVFTLELDARGLAHNLNGNVVIVSEVWRAMDEYGAEDLREMKFKAEVEPRKSGRHPVAPYHISGDETMTPQTEHHRKPLTPGPAHYRKTSFSTRTGRMNNDYKDINIIHVEEMQHDASGVDGYWFIYVTVENNKQGSGFVSRDLTYQGVHYLLEIEMMQGFKKHERIARD